MVSTIERIRCVLLKIMHMAVLAKVGTLHKQIHVHVPSSLVDPVPPLL